MSQFVLKEVVASEKFKKPIYFRMMTRIGPCNTDKLEEAHKFESAKSAKGHSANWHSLSIYEAEEVQ